MTTKEQAALDREEQRALNAERDAFDAGQRAHVAVYRATLTHDDSCECGKVLNAGESCHAYDIGGGSAYACDECAQATR